MRFLLNPSRRQTNYNLEKENIYFLTLERTTCFIRVLVIQSDSKVLTKQHYLSEEKITNGM